MEDQLIDAIVARTGHPDRAAVETALSSTLRALGGQLGVSRLYVDAAVPAAWRRELAATDGTPQTPEALYDLVAQETGMRPGVALELVQSIVAEIAQRLRPAARNNVRQDLTDAWAELVVDPRPPSVARPAAPSTADLGHGHTLATGRPGSEHTLADGRPPGGHSQSIAQSDDPHDADRLSSTHGSRSEQHGETLADGRPGQRVHSVVDSD